MTTSILLPQNIDQKHTWGQLHGASLPLALAEYCQQTSGVKLLIAADNLRASQLLLELRFFLQESQEILFFPDWETLPYDKFSPHQDIISQRLYTLSRLQQSSNAIVISAAR